MRWMLAPLGWVHQDEDDRGAEEALRYATKGSPRRCTRTFSCPVTEMTVPEAYTPQARTTSAVPVAVPHPCSKGLEIVPEGIVQIELKPRIRCTPYLGTLPRSLCSVVCSQPNERWTRTYPSAYYRIAAQHALRWLRYSTHGCLIKRLPGTGVLSTCSNSSRTSD